MGELFLCPTTYLLSSPTSTTVRERPRLNPTLWPRLPLVRLLEVSSLPLTTVTTLGDSDLWSIMFLLSTAPTIPTQPTMERERPRLSPTPWPRLLLVRQLEVSSPMLEATPSLLIVLLLSTLPTIPTPLPSSTTAGGETCSLLPRQEGK